jgi:hypothetical protein
MYLPAAYCGSAGALCKRRLPMLASATVAGPRPGGKERSWIRLLSWANLHLDQANQLPRHRAELRFVTPPGPGLLVLGRGLQHRRVRACPEPLPAPPVAAAVVFTPGFFACSELAGEGTEVFGAGDVSSVERGREFSRASTKYPDDATNVSRLQNKNRQRPPVLLVVAGCKGDGSDDYLKGYAHDTVSASDGI